MLFRMIHAGNALLAMGNGIGGPGRKFDKCSGVHGKQLIECERGRKPINNMINDRALFFHSPAACITFLLFTSAYRNST